MIKAILVLIMSVSVMYAEVKKEFYKTGELRAEEVVNEKGQLDGKKTFYFKSGKVWSVSNYKNGKRDGISKVYYENGNVKKDLIFSKNGKKKIGKYYYISGKEKENYSIDMSGRQLAKGHYEDGTLSFELYYEKEKKGFIYKLYFQNGKLKEIVHELNGTNKLWYETGILKSEEDIKDKKFLGTKKQYYKDGSLNYEWTKDICGNGIKKNYNEKGITTREWQQIDGCGISPIIVITKFYQNGNVKLKTQSFKGGKGQKIEEAYYLNGKREYKMNFNDDKMDGTQYFYNKNGYLISEEIIKNGKKNGVFKAYDKNGLIQQKITYSDDIKIKTTIFQNRIKAFTLFFRGGVIQNGIYYQNGREHKIPQSEIVGMNNQKR